MELEVFSDMVCPWCLLGKRRLESALNSYAHRDEVRLTWRSFQLRPDADPDAPPETVPETMRGFMSGPREVAERLAYLERLAAAEGLEYNLATANVVSTYDAHRLTHFANDNDAGEAFREAVMIGYTRDNVILTDHDTLVRLAEQAGLDGEQTRRVLADDSYGDHVRADRQRARELGVSGVPTFVVDGRAGISGAQPIEVFHALFERGRIESVENSQAATGS